MSLESSTHVKSKFLRLGWVPLPGIVDLVIAKSRYFRSSTHARPTFLGLGGLRSPNVLDLTTKSRYFASSTHVRPTFLGLGGLRNSSVLNLTNSEVHVIWVWHICQIHIFWTRLSSKSKHHIGLCWLSSPSMWGLATMLDPRHLDLENMSNLHYFVFGWLPSLDALDIAYLPDPYVLNNQRKKIKNLIKSWLITISYRKQI